MKIMENGTENASSACRLCDKNATKMHNVFDKNVEGLQIIHLITQCLPLVIYRTDPLSKSICEDCYNNLHLLFTFRKRSLEIVGKQKERLLNSSINDHNVQLYLDALDNEYTTNACKCVNNCKLFQNVQNHQELLTELFQCDLKNGERNEFEKPRSYTRVQCARRGRRFGPKSQPTRTPPVMRIKIQTVYNPLTLLQCALNEINKAIVPDFVPEEFEIATIEERVIDCNYCEQIFMTVEDLAEHESQHIFTVLGKRVDDGNSWNGSTKDTFIRNKWLEDNTEDDTPEPELTNGGLENKTLKAVKKDDDLLVPIAEGISSADYEILLVDTKPTVSGLPLSQIPKDKRRDFYRTVSISGLKRKFCPLCRFTFKDNWAIESHYFSSGCHYTCRFCGVRFNKQRHLFDDHVKAHILAGDVHSNKVFAPHKSQSPIPKVIAGEKLKIRSPFVNRAMPKIRPLKMKTLLQKKPMLPPMCPIKKEPADQYEMRPPQSQAYFCRKCFEVFFKLDEFNVHIIACTGKPKNILDEVKMREMNFNDKRQRSPSPESDGERYSLSGRPKRHCVKEVNSYADPEISEEQKNLVVSHTEQSFECTLCSSCFPTVQSRNSHMRVHKAHQRHSFPPKNIQKPYNNYATRGMKEDRQSIPSFSRYVNNTRIKHEPTEPLVEIHEGHEIPSSIGSVSITPIPNASQRTCISPNIMKLVQNNPNLTIKTMNRSNVSEGPSTPNNNDESGITHESDRFYRCSSCSKPFANKSNLYFHKKNQCSGSKYPCPFCKKRFGTEAAYSSHIFYNHPE